MDHQLAIKALALLSAGVIITQVMRVFLSPHLSSYKHIPAPKQGNVLFRLLYEPRVPEIEAWMDKIPHSGLIRYYGIFNRERIFIASPDAAKDLLGSANSYKFIKPELQWILANNIAGHGLLIQEGDEHKEARKRFNPTFSPAQMKKWFPRLWGTTIETMNGLEKQVQQNTVAAPDTTTKGSMRGVTSILRLVSAASIDMIGHFGYDVEFKTLQNLSKRRSQLKETVEDPKPAFGRAYIEMFKTTRRGQLTLNAASLIGPKIALALPIPAVKTIHGIMGLVRRTAEHIVTTRERSISCKSEGLDTDMLTMIMGMDHFSHAELVEQTVHFLAAGTETVAGSTCWAIHLLSRHPEIQHRLREEIRANVTSPYIAGKEAVSESQFTNLKYLNAVVEEVLRFHSINTLLWRTCIEPATISGVPVTKGTAIVFSPWALNRDPAHWGPDGRVFNPERWLNDPSGGSEHPYSFLTFGGGPRRCVGEQYARNELLCLVAGLIGRFQFSPLNPYKESDEGQEIGDNFALTIFKIYSGWKLQVEQVPGW
ncbi:hypothetical protein JX265_004845 [Neoarthrinium moseri]|uniref:Cytochrome P450 n=1 Tax=Neoarthrinium moseri TaxID=1658444 RepID=A0A9P9WQB7_9PEZI|nr:hypothetical protein JX265_004845 [Neoarthrinium moseri]